MSIGVKTRPIPLNFVARRKRFSLIANRASFNTDRHLEHSTTIFGLLWFIRLAALLYILRRKRHRSIQCKKLYLRPVKCITKHQYSSDLWPLKIKRNWSNCIVDKSLEVRIVDKSLAVRLNVS
jgi:hypothetical protein